MASGVALHLPDPDAMNHLTDIRQLGAADVPLMRDVLSLFADAFDDRRTYLSQQPDNAYLSGLLGDENFICIAACDGPRVIGALAGYVLRKFEQARSECYIYDLAVDAGCRRQGVATGMIAELREIAVARGIYVIFVQADYGDDPAIALYTKLGTREDVMHFDIHPASEGR